MVFIGVLGFVIGFIAVMAASSVANGFVLGILWKWFVVPVFGLSALTLPQSMGIALIVGSLTRTYTGDLATKEEPQGKQLGKRILFSFLSPLLALIIGWIIHQFM